MATEIKHGHKDLADGRNRLADRYQAAVEKLGFNAD
jgi:hypothetical protein